MRNTGGFKTEAAYVASLIKKELKAKYPQVKFSVKSQTYSGGDSVDVHYVMEDESYPTQETIQTIVNKYQAGHFDGMTDMYEYDSTQTGPTVKYAFAHADTKLLEEKHKSAFLQHWGLTAFDDQEIMQKLGCWKEQALYRYINSVVLKKG